ncbi:hypothetical protein RAS1_31640 [Phycisphaerae bacterium RAS1]|nr:hypothetical protein RAS1_31640 [Phycisphaerae bacterium RAS1]
MRLLARSAVFALMLAAVAVSQSAVHWGENPSDSYLFGYSGWQILHGARPYADVWDNKPPGIWWLAAGAMALTGESRFGEIAVSAAALTVTLAALVAIARSLYGRAVTLPAVLIGAALLTHLRYECGAFRTETFVTACECALVAAYLRWRRGNGTAWLVLAGLAAGGGPWFKQSGVAAAAACGMHLLWLSVRGQARWRDAGIFAAAAGLPSLCAVGVLTCQGVLGEWWYAVVEFNRLYFEVRDAAWMPSLRMWRFFEQPLTPLAGVGLLALAGAVLHVLRVRACSDHADSSQSGGGRPKDFIVVPLWLVLSVYLILVSGGVLAYHLAPLLPPLALLALSAVGRLAGGGSLARAIVRRPSAAIVVALLAGICINVYSDSLSFARKAWSTKTHWYSPGWAQPPEFVEQAEVIRSMTTASDTIYVWGWDPGLYRFTLRRCCSRHATLEKVSQIAPRGGFILSAAVGDIRARRPAVVAMSAADHEQLRCGATAEFASWLAANYELAAEVRGMRILRVRLAGRETTR